MSPITVEEKIQCLKNLLADPDCWISSEILRLSDEEEQGSNGPVGMNETCPEAHKSPSKTQ